MQTLQIYLDKASGFIWSEYLLIPLLTLCGIYLTIGLKCMPWRQIPQAFCLLWGGQSSYAADKGSIPPFQALMTALSATIGTGNIAGVATAIYFGGPGAIFWMWVIALFGMATKYAEAVLAVKYRETDTDGNTIGGPMYYIRNGMGPQWAWLGYAFAIFGMIAAFGIGNMVQSNSVADAVNASFGISAQITGAIVAILAAFVILGGIQRIGAVAAKLVPFMAIAYILGGLSILLLNISDVPAAIGLIVSDAFTGTAAQGGFLGASVLMAIRWGFARGIFSNEAGLGSAAIAHAAAKTNSPVQQGQIAMLGTFIDTVLVCSITALVIIVTGVWDDGVKGAAMSALAFDTGLKGIGGYIVTIGLIIFAFTTILGWSYYGERCAEFIFGKAIILPYRILWIIAIFIGAVLKLGLVWALADVLNGLMAIPNLIALLVLSPVVFKLTKEYLKA